MCCTGSETIALDSCIMSSRVPVQQAVHGFEVEVNMIEFVKLSREVRVSIMVLLDFLLSISDMTHRFSRVVFIAVTFPLDQVLDSSSHQLSIQNLFYNVF